MATPFAAVSGDIWALAESYRAQFARVGLCIPTNGTRTRDGHAVMGKGLALQAKQRYDSLPMWLGIHLRRHGNVPMTWNDGLITFPTKHDWRDDASLDLIAASAKHAVELAPQFDRILLPRLGAGLGRLPWDAVLATLDPIFRPIATTIILVAPVRTE